MAIGVRIFSENLSGETGFVTFYPKTGGTIVLGEKTIPFNNIDPYPYGKYDIFISKYDFTYKVNIPPICTPTPTPTQVVPTPTPTPIPGTICIKGTRPPSSAPNPCVGSSNWLIRNSNCGFGTINDIGINNNFIGDTLLGQSRFPLTSTLTGTKLNPNGVNYCGLNTIQANVTTNLAGNGNCYALRIWRNNQVAYTSYFSTNPFPSITGVTILPGDNVEVETSCFVGPCPTTTTTTIIPTPTPTPQSIECGIPWECTLSPLGTYNGKPYYGVPFVTSSGCSSNLIPNHFIRYNSGLTRWEFVTGGLSDTTPNSILTSSSNSDLPIGEWGSLVDCCQSLCIESTDLCPTPVPTPTPTPTPTIPGRTEEECVCYTIRVTATTRTILTYLNCVTNQTESIVLNPGEFIDICTIPSSIGGNVIWDIECATPCKNICITPTPVPPTPTPTPTGTPFITPTPVPRNCEDCDPEFDWEPLDENCCYSISETIGYVPKRTPWTKGATVNTDYGTKFYNQNFDSNGHGQTVFEYITPYMNGNYTGTLWGNPDRTTNRGPLNSYGVQIDNPLNVWIGFSFCLTADTSSEYWIGIAADDRYKITLNGSSIIDQLNDTSNFEDNFRYFHVYPLSLINGINTLEVFGLNSGFTSPQGILACEVYKNTLQELTAATSHDQLNVLFTTSGKTEIGISRNTDGSNGPIGYICPTGYTYQSCLGRCVNYNELCCDTTRTICIISQSEAMAVDSRCETSASGEYNGYPYFNIKAGNVLSMGAGCIDDLPGHVIWYNSDLGVWVATSDGLGGTNIIASLENSKSPNYPIGTWTQEGTGILNPVYTAFECPKDICFYIGDIVDGNFVSGGTCTVTPRFFGYNSQYPFLYEIPNPNGCTNVPFSYVFKDKDNAFSSNVWVFTTNENLSPAINILTGSTSLEYPIGTWDSIVAADTLYSGLAVIASDFVCPVPPPDLCISFGGEAMPVEFRCITSSLGYYNGKPFYNVLNSNCSQPINDYYVWYDSGNTQWVATSDGLGGNTVESYLPESNSLSNIIPVGSWQSEYCKYGCVTSTNYSDQCEPVNPTPTPTPNPTPTPTPTPNPQQGLCVSYFGEAPYSCETTALGIHDGKPYYGVPLPSPDYESCTTDLIPNYFIKYNSGLTRWEFVTGGLSDDNPESILTGSTNPDLPYGDWIRDTDNYEWVNYTGPECINEICITKKSYYVGTNEYSCIATAIAQPSEQNWFEVKASDCQTTDSYIVYNNILNRWEQKLSLTSTTVLSFLNRSSSLSKTSPIGVWSQSGGCLGYYCISETNYKSTCASGNCVGYRVVTFDRPVTTSDYIFWKDCCTGNDRFYAIPSGVTSFDPTLEFDSLECIKEGSFRFNSLLNQNINISYVEDCTCYGLQLCGCDNEVVIRPDNLDIDPNKVYFDDNGLIWYPVISASTSTVYSSSTWSGVTIQGDDSPYETCLKYGEAVGANMGPFYQLCYEGLCVNTVQYTDGPFGNSVYNYTPILSTTYNNRPSLQVLNNNGQPIPNNFIRYNGNLDRWEHVTDGISGSTVVSILTGSTDYNLPIGIWNPVGFNPFIYVVKETSQSTDCSAPSPSGIQTASILSKITGSTSWHSAVLDYSGFTAQLIDLNVDDTYWTNAYDFYPTNEKGYMYVFSNNLDERLVIFTDAVGNETFRYTGSTNYPTYAIAGHSNAFIDPPDGVLVYGDGISTPTTFSWDPLEYEGDINWDWDIAEKTGNFILELRKLDDTLKKNYLMTSSGGILIDEYDPTSIIKYYGLYNDGDFFYEYAWNELEGKYESLKFYDGSNATILESIVFSGGQTYDNFYSRFYGNNQFVIVFYNSSDNNVDYLIYHYDGNTRTLDTQTHNRSNYQSITIQGETNFFPNEVGSDSVFIILYTQTGFDNRVGQEVSYLDIVYKLSGESSLTTYTYQDSGVGDKWFYVSPYCGSNLFTICDNGDGNASVFSITQSGVIVDPLTAKTDFNYFGFDYFGDVAVVRLETTTPNTFLFYYVNSQGQVSDSIVVDSSSWWNSDERYGNWWIFVDATNEGYYINESVTGFTSIPYYQNYERGQNYYEKNNFKRPSDIVFFNDITFESQVLTRTTISSVFTLPANNGTYSIEVGKSRFMYTYLDQTTGLLNINLYDFEYNLVNSISTEQTGWDSTDAVKDRYYVKVTDGPNHIYYLVSDSEIEFVTTSNEYDWRQINDYIWWD